MFNQEQIEHMVYLSSISDDKLCWCGWNLLGECYNCPKNLSLLDKKKVWCKDCRNEPSNYGKGKIIHRIGCKLETQEEKEEYNFRMKEYVKSKR
jgi:hypothetical protein